MLPTPAPQGIKSADTNTYKYIQIHTDTYKYVQILTNKYKYIGIHTDTATATTTATATAKTNPRVGAGGWVGWAGLVWSVGWLSS